MGIFIQGGLKSNCRRHWPAAHLKSLLLLFFSTILFFSPAAAQPYQTRNYAIEEGLIQSQAVAMHQDHAGYLWIGTFGGLSRFDGLNFEHFTIDEGLISNRILAITEDFEGNLWAGSINGITVLTDSSMYHLTTSNGLLDNSINSLERSSDGTIWIASQGGLSRYDGHTFQHYTTDDGLASAQVIAVDFDRDEIPWVATTNGLCRLSDEQFTCYGQSDGLPPGAVVDVLVDRQNRVWTAAGGGVSVLDNGETRFRPLPVLKQNPASRLLEDASGSIWIGAQRGLIRLDSTGAVTHSWQDGKWIVTSLLEDREHNIWAGTSGRGVVKLQQTAFSHMNPVYNLPRDVYLGVFEDHQNRRWIGTLINGMYKVEGDSITHFNRADYPDLHHVRNFAEDQEGNLWIATSGGALRYDGATFTHYGRAEGLAAPYVFGIHPDKQGRVWIGTMNGVSVIEKDSVWTMDLALGNDRKLAFSFAQPDPEGMWIGTVQGLMYYDSGRLRNIAALRKRPVISILPDPSGDLWLGTLGYGVLRFNPETGTLVDSLTVVDGLNSSSVYFTRFDHDGNLWVGTSRGVSHVDMAMYNSRQIKNFRAYGKTDGIVGLETNTNAATVDHEGKLWFGTIDALIHHDAAARPINTIPPPVYLKETRLFLEKTDLAQFRSTDATVTFPHHQNHLTFDFVGISYTAPELVRYKYRLNGFDADWQPASESRFATYANLPPGSYTFEVIAINSDGTESLQPATLSFIVTPPFWKTGWFIGLSILSMVLGVVGLIQLRTRSLNRRRLALERMVATRTEDLKKTNAELVQAREAALQAARSKSAFMSAMTHELRTPMNGILGMTQVLTITEMDEEQMDCAQTIMDCSTMMMDLIENLLTFSDLAAGQRTLSVERFHLAELLNQTLSDVRSKSPNQHIETRYFLSPAVPQEIEADREHTRQILNHLLSNALKFTQAGIVYVEVQLERLNQARQQAEANLLFSVHDTGIGMEQHQLKRIFEAFSQADMSLNRQFQGTGIGLALVQQLTALLNGNLGAESWPGIGSSFYFSLPLQHPPAPPLLAEYNQSALHGTRIWIDLEDEREKRRLALLCRSMGMEVAEAFTSETAMVMVDKKQERYQSAVQVVIGAQLPVEASGEEVEQVLHAAAGVGRAPVQS